MISINRTTESTSAASEVLVPPAETARACTERQRRLTEYIRAHTGEDIAVRLTPFVPTACVMPTSKETLVESDNADLSPEEAEQLVSSVDADYLVLISTAPANIERLPITDQLTADRAQQFGYALHELGHIRYTAIADAATLLEDRIDAEHHEFVHGLWNSCEDAAIENQLTADQSQLAADRLEIVNRSVSTTPDEFSPDQQAKFSFRDGIETALYDRGIYDTGTCKRLCDSSDEQFVFAADADRQAFAEIDDSINDLLTTILTTPSSTERVETLLEWWETEIEPLLSPPNQDESSRKQQDEDGAKAGDATSDGQSQDNAEQHGKPSTEQEREEDEASQTAGGSEESASDPSSESVGEQEDGNEREAGERTETHPDPSAINTDHCQETPGTDALEYPDLGNEEDAEALRQPSEDAGSGSETSEDTSASGADGSSKESDEDEADSKSESETGVESNSISESSESDGSQGKRESIPENTDDGPESPTDSAKGVDKSSDEASESGSGDPSSDTHADQKDRSEGGNGEKHDSDSTSSASAEANPWMDSDSSSQTSLGSFAQTEDQPEGSGNKSPLQSDEGSASNDEVMAPEDAASDRNTSSDSGLDQDGRDSVGGSSNEGSTDADETVADTLKRQDDRENGAAESVDDSEADESDQPDHSDTEMAATETSEQRGETTSGEHEDESSTESSQNDPDDVSEEGDNQKAPQSDPMPAHQGSDLETSDALDADREGARDEAERSTPDRAQLERDLGDVAAALDQLEDKDGGTGAAPSSLDELSVMPNTIDVATDQSIIRRWENADADASYVANALRKALKENRRTEHRSGLTSGSFDRRRAAALARGEVTAFQVRQPGDEKQYDLVMILDRSGSMRKHIQTAEDALVRFALACEDIGINVGVIDFTDDKARLVKPFSVECEHVRTSLLSKQYGGNTPLADALGLGRELLEQRRNSPLVLVVTDGKPGDADAYHDGLAQSYAPVCGLTLVLDQPSGSVPKTVARNEQFYDRHVYVHEPGQLADRLDQFAMMFSGL